MAWDEIGTLRAVVESQLEALGRFGVTFELVIIDDGSTDGTSEEADRLAQEHQEVRVIHHGANRGLGECYRTGFRDGRGVFLTFFPADGQFPASNLAQLYPLAESWDLVLGNLPKRTDSLRGALLGRMERLVYRGLFGEMPRLEGVFMLRRKLLSEIELKSEGRAWTLVWELILRAHRSGYRIVAAPNTLVPRTHGVSKVSNVRNIVANLTQLVALRSKL